MIRHIINIACYCIIMLDPRAPTCKGVRGWMLARAGEWAFDGS
jgi:hypothetical protein